jgi:FlaA1/EpsC-like NDP-sugar epimerase
MTKKFKTYRLYRKLIINQLSLNDFTYMPRWSILLIDVFLVSISFLICRFLLEATNMRLNSEIHLAWKLSIYLSIHVISFRLFSTHLGLIRHSSFLDAVKIFFTLLFAHVILIFGDHLQAIFTDQRIFLSTSLMVYFMMSYIALLLFRICVKYMFDKYKGVSSKMILKKAVIFGVDANAVALAEALMKESPIRFQIIAFIDLGSNSADKRILNIPIRTFDESFADTLEDLDTEVLIIATRSINEKQKFKIVEDCAQANIRIYAANLITDMASREVNDKSGSIRDLKIEDLLHRPAIQLDFANVAKSIYDKVILVTGGAGSIGSEILSQLGMYNPRKIIIVDQAETPMHDLELQLRNKFPHLQYEIRIGDITDAHDMERIFKQNKPHIIYHAAAYKHVPMMEKNPIQAVMANVLGAKNIADLALKYEAERFIFVSTDKAVNPTNIMGATKKIAEIYTQSLYFQEVEKGNKQTTKFITTRFGNVLGSNGSVVPLFQKQIEKGGPVTLTHPEVTRFFMTIPEACQLVLQAGSLGEGGEIFLFDMGEPIKIYDLAKKMIQLAGLIPNHDIEIKFVGMRPGEKLYEELYDEYAETVPTHHQKILKVIDRVPNHANVLNQLSDLMQSLQAGDCESIVKNIKEIVPEYHCAKHEMKEGL